MRQPQDSRKARLAIEPLEDRQLLSGFNPALVKAQAAHAALVRKLNPTPLVRKVNPTPIVHKPTPVVRRPTPVVRKPAPNPIVRRPTPVVRKPAPTPVVRKPTPTPVVRKPTPTPIVRRPTPTPTPTPVKTDPSAVSAIQSALTGGVGSEWATLITREVGNPLTVVGQFASGQSSTFSAPGITFRNPLEQPAFTGQPYDQLLPLAAGGGVFRNNVMEFATILRGEFRDPNTSYYVFAVDRGAGASLGAPFASRPGITPDALVTITVGPFGSSPTGEIHDLTDGSVQAIDPSNIAIQGATLRVFLNASQLPSRGAQIAGYRFALWTQAQLLADITTVASFAPDASMIPIAVATDVSVSR